MSGAPEDAHLARMHRFKFGPFDMNPVVSIGAAAVIWGFVFLAAQFPEDMGKELGIWSSWITSEWTWLYIGSQNIWIGVLIYILCSKYRHIKLGKDDEKPKYSFGTWFAMLFTCGVATGLWYYTAESMWHYKNYGSPRWANMPDNERAIHSMMVTWFHWGLHGWIPYTLVGALVGIMSYRRDMPMTMRFCFYPLIGDRVYGWIGDVVDILSIVVTLFGVCTSLGLGVRQIYKGLVRLDAGTYRGTNSNADPMLGFTTETEDEIADIETNRQIIIIWCITAIATVSVVSGIDRGIKRLGQLAFFLSAIVVLSQLFMGDTAFILNAITETIGYYIWYLPKISFITDAFPLLGPATAVLSTDDEPSWSGGRGGAPDGISASDSWMDGWTIFYWGWWISWGPFVGTFMAKISRGRTLGQFITCSLIVPSLYSFFFMGVWGAEGIRLQNMAETEGITCADTYSKVSPAINLYCLGTEDIVFDQISAYGGKTLGDVLTVTILFSIVIYFVTSSDSGSLVIDIMAANGLPEPPIVQRIFWACSEGATASVLLSFGGEVGLKALRSVSLICGLPYTFCLFWFCQSLLYVCYEEAGDLDKDRPDMRSFITNIDHTKSGSYVSGLIKIATALVFPPLQLGLVMANVWKETIPGQWFIINIIWEGSMVLLCFIAIMDWEYQCVYICGAVYILFMAMMATVRADVRTKVGCERGDWLTDFLVCCTMYPLAIPQMHAELSAHSAAEGGTKNAV